MKRFMSVMLAAAMAISLTACGGGSTSSSTGGSAAEAQYSELGRL